MLFQTLSICPDPKATDITIHDNRGYFVPILGSLFVAAHRPDYSRVTCECPFFFRIPLSMNWLFLLSYMGQFPDSGQWNATWNRKRYSQILHLWCAWNLIKLEASGGRALIQVHSCQYSSIGHLHLNENHESGNRLLADLWVFIYSR